MNENLSKLVKILVKKYAPEKVILFGSYAWGKPNKHSDIDLFIIKNTRKKRRERFTDVQRILHGSHEKIPVEPLVLTPKELEKRMDLNDPFVMRILKQGKYLYGQ